MSIERINAIAAREVAVRRLQRLYLGGFIFAIVLVLIALATMYRAP